MGEILMIILSSFVLPLLANILFELWKEKRSKDKKQDWHSCFFDAPFLGNTLHLYHKVWKLCGFIRGGFSY